MRFKLKSALLILLFLGTGTGLAEPQALPNVLSVKKVVKNMQDSFAKMSTFKSRFKITTERGTSKPIVWEGEVKYKSPQTIIFLFETPKDQLIFSDGKILKIYVPELRVIGEQKLNMQNQDVMFINSKTSFYQLQRQYNFFLADNPVRTVSGQKVVILNLKRKNVNSGFKSIDLWISMDDWLIMKAVAKTREDKTVTMNFHDIDINPKITENEFLFNLPVDIQTIHDPLYSTGLNVKKR